MKSLFEAVSFDEVTKIVSDWSKINDWKKSSRHAMMKHSPDVAKTICNILSIPTTKLVLRTFVLDYDNISAKNLIQFHKMSSGDFSKAINSKYLSSSFNSSYIRNLTNSIFSGSKKEEVALKKIAEDSAKYNEYNNKYYKDSGDVIEQAKNLTSAYTITYADAKMVLFCIPSVELNYWSSGEDRGKPALENKMYIVVFTSVNSIPRILLNDELDNGTEDTNLTLSANPKKFLATAFGAKTSYYGVANFSQSTQFLNNLVKTHSSTIKDTKSFVTGGLRWKVNEKAPFVKKNNYENPVLGSNAEVAYFSANKISGNIFAFIITNGGYEQEYIHQERVTADGGPVIYHTNPNDDWRDVTEYNEYRYVIGVKLDANGNFIEYLHDKNKPMAIIKFNSVSSGLILEEPDILVKLKRKINELAKQNI